MEINGNGFLNGAPAPSTVGNYRGNDAAVISEQAFMLGYERSNTGSQYSHIQIINPVASGIIVLLDSFRVSCSSSNEVMLAQYDTALSGSAGTPGNKNIGGAAAVATVLQESNVATLGTDIGKMKFGSTNGTDFINDYPFILGEGEGILAVCNAVNVALYGLLQWREL